MTRLNALLVRGLLSHSCTLTTEYTGMPDQWVSCEITNKFRKNESMWGVRNETKVIIDPVRKNDLACCSVLIEGYYPHPSWNWTTEYTGLPDRWVTCGIMKCYPKKCKLSEVLSRGRIYFRLWSGVQPQANGHGEAVRPALGGIPKGFHGLAPVGTRGNRQKLDRGLHRQCPVG